jgi:hypothetical protein
MCAINPVHKKRFVIDVYTSDRELTKREFTELAMNELVNTEVRMNLSNPHLRFHLKESDQEAD